VSGDVHVLLGALPPEDYTGPTPDGRPPTAEFAAERLARVVCADGEMLHGAEIRAIAEAIALAQVAEIADALRRVARRLPRPAPVIATGLGSFLACRAAERAGMPVADIADVLGVDVGTVAPAVAVAWLALDT
jgi:uncharacterized hydantoinase/oxoprolinase family protein